MKNKKHKYKKTRRNRKKNKQADLQQSMHQGQQFYNANQMQQVQQNYNANQMHQNKSINTTQKNTTSADEGLVSSIINSMRNFSERIRLSLSLKLSFSFSGAMFGTLANIFFLTIILFTALTGYLLYEDNEVIHSAIQEKIAIDLNNPEAQGISDILYAILDKDNQVVYSNFVQINDYTTKNINVFFINHENKIYFVYWKGVQSTNNSVIYFYDLEDYIFYIKYFVMFFALMLILTFLSYLIKGYKKSNDLLSPIDELNTTVKQISAANMNLRINVSDAKDELRELVRTFNSMMDRIQGAYEGREQFVSDASHELRTPISVIKGYINMLDRWGKKDEKILEESINAIQSETESMQEMVEKLLFLARSDKKTLKINPEIFNVSKMAEEIVSELKLLTDKHQIIGDIEKSFFVKADRPLIKQAVRVFTENALKYGNEKGYIKIICKNENNQCIIGIEDNGIGMTQTELSHVFDRFYRSESQEVRSKKGHGLGLPIARAIISGHNGKIKIKSKKNKGTTVQLVLPL